MGKLNTLLEIVKEVITNPGSLRQVVDPEKKYKKYIQKKYPQFVKGLPVIAYADLVNVNEVAATPVTYLDGNSLVTDVMLLKSLVKRVNDAVYFEIGTWRGESVANIAPLAKQCYTLNLSDDEMRAMGLDEKYIQLHCYFSKKINNVEHIRANSFTFDFSKYKHKIDVVFVDGDHHYKGVMSDTKNCWQLLRNENAVMLWHDYAFHPEKIRYEVLAGILDGCTPEQLKNLYHVADTKCAVWIKGNFKTSTLQPFDSPGHYYQVQLQSRQV